MKRCIFILFTILLISCSAFPVRGQNGEDVLWHFKVRKVELEFFRFEHVSDSSATKHYQQVFLLGENLNFNLRFYLKDGKIRGRRAPSYRFKDCDKDSILSIRVFYRKGEDKPLVELSGESHLDIPYHAHVVGGYISKFHYRSLDDFILAYNHCANGIPFGSFQNSPPVYQWSPTEAGDYQVVVHVAYASGRIVKSMARVSVVDP